MAAPITARLSTVERKSFARQFNVAFDGLCIDQNPIHTASFALASTVILTLLLPPPAFPDPPQDLQSHLATQTVNAGVPSDGDLSDSGPGGGSSQGQIQSRGRGCHGRGGCRGRGGRGGQGAQGGRGGIPKENNAASTSNHDTDDDANPMRPLSTASRRRINTLNKKVYPPDGAPVALLGASHSINVDGMVPMRNVPGAPHQLQ